jgi:O-antigen/teichoic acid export membrane protein
MSARSENNSHLRYFAGSFAWSVVAKVLDAAVKFFTIPLLLKYFGKDNYGILVLAVSTNAYMGLLDLGINIGAIKFYSQWILEKKYSLIQSVSRTSISFYLIIGSVNSLILLILAIFGNGLFNISNEQFMVLRNLLFIVAFFCLINWCETAITQLLIANEKISTVQRTYTIKSILNLLLVLFTINSHISLTIYYLLMLTINSSFISIFIVKAKSYELIKSILPGKDWANFKQIFKYSLAIIAMGIFQFTASQSRPLILGIFNVTGVGILSEYRIIEVFPLFILSVGGIILTILLPKTSKLVHEGDQDKIRQMAYKGTLYTTIIGTILCIPVLINRRVILDLYVGSEYRSLAVWMALWVFTLVIYLHNSPVSSLVLATGKTRMLVYSSAFSCIVSIVLNALLCRYMGVGSAVIGYLTYVIIQTAFYYLYFNKKVLNLNSMKVFTSFIVPSSIGVVLSIPLLFIHVTTFSNFVVILGKSLIWFVLFLSALYYFKIIDRSFIKDSIRNL